MIRISVGQSYQTHSAGTVKIIEDLGQGRKRFVGVLENLDAEGNAIQVRYFRNGAYANSSKEIHPYTIVKKANP